MRLFTYGCVSVVRRQMDGSRRWETERETGSQKCLGGVPFQRHLWSVFRSNSKDVKRGEWTKDKSDDMILPRRVLLDSGSPTPTARRERIK